MIEQEMDFENRIVSPEYSYTEDEAELSLRPKSLNEYIGQDKVKENLSIYIIHFIIFNFICIFIFSLLLI